jgi:hypothetical protein
MRRTLIPIIPSGRTSNVAFVELGINLGAKATVMLISENVYVANVAKEIMVLLIGGSRCARLDFITLGNGLHGVC